MRPALSFDIVSHAELVSLSAVLTPGMHVVLGGEADGTRTLIALAAGLVWPGVGSVQLGGEVPFSSARLRRSIGSLCAVEALPPARSVSHAVALVLRARADSRSVTSVLGVAGLMHLAARRSEQLSTRETRAVALALALCHPKPTLLALHDPLRLTELVREEFILDSLHAAAENGAIVLASASHAGDAAHLGGQSHALTRGIWQSSAEGLNEVLGVTLRVQTPDARQLAERLTGAADIEAVTWASTRDLLVRGADLERVAHRVVSTARAAAIRISALRQEPQARPQ